MFRSKQRLFVVAAALLTALALTVGLFTGTGLAQDAQPDTPDAGRHNGMMGSHMGHGMMRHGMMGQGMMMCRGQMAHGSRAAVSVTDTVDATQAGLAASFPATLASADAKRGQQLTLANGCIGCHALDSDQMAVGPTWHDLAESAATRVEGQSAEEYLYTSIVRPNAYVVNGYQANVMVQGYGQTLHEQDIADIVKYLLSLQG